MWCGNLNDLFGFSLAFSMVERWSFLCDSRRIRHRVPNYSGMKLFRILILWY